MENLKRYLTYAIIILFPIMSIVNINASFKLNIAVSDIPLILLGLVWLIDIRNFKIKQNYPYFWYFISLILVLIISGIYNLNSNTVSGGINGIIAEGIKVIVNAVYLFIGYNSFKDKYELKDIIKCWIIGLWIFIVYGLYKQISALMGLSFISFNNFFGDGTRFLGTITDPNAAALYLSVSFFIVLWAKNFICIERRQRILLNITNIFVFICIILTLSRGGIIGFAVGFIFYIIFNIKNLVRKLYFLPILVVIILLISVTDSFVLNGYIKEQIITRTEDILQKKGMFNIRLNLTFSAIDMGMDNFVIGVGRGNYPLNSKEYIIERGGDWERDGEQFYKNMVSHNTLAGIFAELGIIGLIIFISLPLILLLKIFNCTNIDSNFKILLLSMWGSIFIQSMSICLENSRVLWIILGINLILLDNNSILTRKLKSIN